MKMTHSFPTKASLIKDALKSVDVNYQIIAQDKQKTNEVLEIIKQWLVGRTNEAIVSQAKVHVNYYAQRPYDYFQITITLDTASLTSQMVAALKRAKGHKIFPFKLTVGSRQDTLGLIAIQTFTEKDLKNEYIGDEGEVGVEAGVGTHLSFIFVEW